MDAERCPFCKSHRITTEFDWSQGSKYGSAVCMECFAHGPEVRTEYDGSSDAPWREEAIREWNKWVIPEDSYE